MARNKQILLIYNLEESTAWGEEKDLIALEETSVTSGHIYRALHELGHKVIRFPIQGTLDELRRQLGRYPSKDTFVFNNCDGFNGINMGSVDVLGVVEEMGFAHSGAPASAVRRCTDKILAKECLSEAGIPTPAYQVIENPSIPLLVELPVIVKPCREDGSVGINEKSVATNAESALQRSAYIIAKYHQPALVEKFIPGRELSLSLWGNSPISVLPVSEQDYGAVPDSNQHLLTYDSKWLPDSFLYQNVKTVCPASLSQTEHSLIVQTGKQVFDAIGLRDFARVDFRLQNGIPWVIDVNDIPDLSPESGFPFSARAAGMGYNDMIRNILDICFQRIGWL